MKTTKKEFKQAVRDHILDSLPGEITVKEELQNLSDEFDGFYYGKQNFQDAFVTFCRGLPSTLNVDFQEYDINNTLADWFNTIGKDFNPDRLEDSMDFYLRLIHREIRHLFKQYGIRSKYII